MKKLFFTLFILLCLSSSFAQILNPVKLDYSLVKKGNNSFEVHIKAAIDNKWHLYSVTNPEGGAVATEIKFNDAQSVGKIKEKGTLKTSFDKEFKINQKYFEKNVEFVQNVKLKSGDKVTGTITYMVCNDKQCLPPKDVEFKIKL